MYEQYGVTANVEKYGRNGTVIFDLMHLPKDVHPQVDEIARISRIRVPLSQNALKLNLRPDIVAARKWIDDNKLCLQVYAEVDAYDDGYLVLMAPNRTYDLFQFSASDEPHDVIGAIKDITRSNAPRHDFMEIDDYHKCWVGFEFVYGEIIDERRVFIDSGTMNHKHLAALNYDTQQTKRFICGLTGKPLWEIP